MYNEARNRPDEATAWYEKILEDGSADQATLRRQIGAVKGAEGPAAAIAKLVKHLEVFQNDLTAWEELAELYVQVGMRLDPCSWTLRPGRAVLSLALSSHAMPHWLGQHGQIRCG